MRTRTRQHTDTRNGEGIDSGDREQVLLDDLRHEMGRLADAVEQQNELLEEHGAGPECGAVGCDHAGEQIVVVDVNTGETHERVRCSTHAKEFLEVST